MMTKWRPPPKHCHLESQTPWRCLSWY